jgi:dTDP-4-dehydrorhamnose 3,5-epimerase
MKVTKTKLQGVVIIEPDVYQDERGFFLQTYQETDYLKAGVTEKFVQDNHSRSTRGVLRGLHFQTKKPQGKLVRVTHGAVYDVAVDINPESPTFTEWVGIELNEDNHLQLYIPPGYAHGFAVLSESADFLYKCTDYFDPGNEIGIAWNDPDIAIDWPIGSPIVSEKDSKWTNLSDTLSQ